MESLLRKGKKAKKFPGNLLVLKEKGIIKEWELGLEMSRNNPGNGKVSQIQEINQKMG